MDNDDAVVSSDVDPKVPRRNPLHTENHSVLKALVILSAILLLIATIHVSSNVIFAQRGGPGHEMIRSINRMKSIGLALLEFEANYDSLPNDQSLELLKREFPKFDFPQRVEYAEDAFNQLIASGMMMDKGMFYGYGVSRNKPTEDVGSLVPGECGFSYVLSDEPVEMMSPDRPLLVYPMLRGDFRFDRKITKLWGHKAAVLHADSSVKTHAIEKDGRVLVDGKDLFDPSQPFWRGKKPVVNWPK